MTTPDAPYTHQHLPALHPAPAVEPSVDLDRAAAQPHMVNLAGTFPPPNDAPASDTRHWNPADPAYLMAYRPADGYWWLTVNLPAGRYDYKVTIDGSWQENYGVRGMRSGPNLRLELRVAEEVTFCFDYDTKITRITESTESR